MAVPWVEGDRLGHTGHVAARLAAAWTPLSGQGAGDGVAVTDLVLGGAQGAVPTQPQSPGMVAWGPHGWPWGSPQRNWEPHGQELAPGKPTWSGRSPDSELVRGGSRDPGRGWEPGRGGRAPGSKCSRHVPRPGGHN